MADTPFLCPHCHAPLARDGKRLVCAAGHSYDLARQGYVNLLPPGRRAHGDNRAMIEARHRFLDSDIYAPLRDRACGMLAQYALPCRRLLDVGCGEGYYTEAFYRAVCQSNGQPTEVVGIDLSRDALIFAARRCPDLHLAAASCYALPLADRSVDCITCFFAPDAAAEFDRVLSPGGLLLLAFPGRRHLWELKEILYDTPYENDVHDTARRGYSIVAEQTVEYRHALSSPEQIRALYEMTPYCYRTPAAGRARLDARTSLSVTCAFELVLYRKDD